MPTPVSEQCDALDLRFGETANELLSVVGQPVRHARRPGCESDHHEVERIVVAPIIAQQSLELRVGIQYRWR